MQVPPWQVSLWVQAFPSLQAVPFAFEGFEQTPVAGLHVPASWHWSSGVHTTGSVPVQTPATHTSLRVQPLPSLQVVPLATLV